MILKVIDALQSFFICLDTCFTHIRTDGPTDGLTPVTAQRSVQCTLCRTGAEGQS